MNAISALVLTYNEAPNIARTLDRLTWIGQVVVLDSFSTDETCTIADRYPNVTIIQRPFDSFAAQCNFGLEQIQTPWVLSIDADYVLTRGLIAEIQGLEPNDNVAGYRAPFTYCVYGRPLRSTLYPDRTVLYRRGRGRYRDEGHGHRVQIDGEVLSLNNKIEHDDRKPFGRWLRSQDRYMVIEARNLLTAPSDNLNFADRLRKRIFIAPAVMFVYLLFARGLILDGWPGWFYVFQRTLAETMLSLRMLIEREGVEPAGTESGPAPPRD